MDESVHLQYFSFTRLCYIHLNLFLCKLFLDMQFLLEKKKYTALHLWQNRAKNFILKLPALKI